MQALLKMKGGVGNIEVGTVEEPTCNDNEVKIEIAYTGICGTDLHIYHDTFKSYPPVILGHECSGIVVEAGKDVQNLKAGDRVTVLGSTERTCGKCIHCKTGFYMFCETRRGMGHGVNGSFTKYLSIKEEAVYKLPQHVSLQEGALAEPLACAVQAIEELTDIKSGDVVLLSGPGPIGLICLSLLAIKGCKVLVSGTDVDAQRLEIAKELGAARVINVQQENLANIVAEETNNQGVDITIDCTGAPMAISSCLEQVKKRGQHIQVGIVGKAFNLDFDIILYKQLQVYGSLAHSITTWDRVMKIYDQNQINLKPIITHVMNLNDWQKAFQLCEEKQCGKVLIQYDESTNLE
ncbi:alcohol dehydrogenase catalytic domain-containing protein [Metasolibacillus sp. FSL H7-0170]|uniref:zinc-dependent alcohol dehydrogenase n=1 Tax=Metasolibacillus sp. FSL H7-0170 TaxID=2921431 RepID=UPI0031590EE8